MGTAEGASKYHDYARKYVGTGVSIDEYIQETAAKIFACDRHTRFVCVLDGKGSVLALTHRKDILLDMSSRESMGQYTAAWTMEVLMADKFLPIAGSMHHMIVKFDKLYAAAVPFSLGPHNRLIIILSFDLDCNPMSIIEDKIMPLVAASKEYLM